MLALLGFIGGWLAVPDWKPEPVPAAVLPMAPSRLSVDLETEGPAVVPTLDRLCAIAQQSGGVALLREIDKIPDMEGVRMLVDEAIDRARNWQSDPDDATTSEAAGEALNFVWKVLMARFAEMDAEKAFEHGMKIAGEDGALPRVVFFELARQRPDLIESVANRLKDSPSSLRSLLSVAYFLADTDPHLALRICREFPTDNNYPMSSVFERWAQRAPQEVIEHAATLTKSEGDEALRIAARIWTLTDAGAALAWAKGRDPENAQGILGEVLGVMGLRDPAQAASLALEIVPNDTAVIAGVGNQWLNQDLDAAFAWILALDNPVQQQGILRYQSEFFEKNPERVLEWMKRFPLNQSVASVYQSFLSQLKQSNLSLAVEWLKTSDRVEALDAARGEVFYQWAVKDPIAAADYAAEHLELITDSSLAGELANHLARRDPVKALEWANQLPTEEFRQRAMRAVIEAATSEHPEEALAMALELKKERGRSGALGNIVSKVRNSQTGDTVEWLSSLPEAAQNELAPIVLARAEDADIGRLLQHPALYDSSGAMTAEALQSIKERASNVVRAANLEAALEWAMTLPEEASIATASSIIGEWSGQDAGAAAELVSSLEDGELKQAAIAAMAPGMANVDPERAWQWALAIEKEDVRNKVIWEVVKDWGTVDRTAARAALADAPMTAEQRQQFEQRIRDRWGGE